MLDILCIGDAVIDVFLSIPKDNPHFGLDEEKNKLFISFGEKINVDNYTMDVGGNASNTSVGISRLGLNVGLCAEIGIDEFSKKIIHKLEEEKIDLSLLKQIEKQKTSFSVGINYLGERTLFVEHVEREHNFNFDSLVASSIYLTSLGKKWENAYTNALRYVKDKNIKLFFNPGTLQIEKKDRLIMEIIENTDYLFLNKEEAEEILYGTAMEGEENLIKKLLFGLKSLGAKNVIITDSTKGSYVYDENNNLYKALTLDVKAVEKTGAGDSYTAGFISAILLKKEIKEAMVWGTLNASSVIQKIGAQEGLLLKDVLEKQLKENTLAVDSI